MSAGTNTHQSVSNSNGSLYNYNVISQIPSTTISNNNISSMHGNTMSQYTMPQQRSSTGSQVKVSLLSQGLKNKSLAHGTKINPHEVSSMYNSFYGDSTQGNGANPTGEGAEIEDVDMQENEKDDLSWLKFGM